METEENKYLKTIRQLRVRIAELEDKDWYEGAIRQLENQNDKLINELDTIKVAFRKMTRQLLNVYDNDNYTFGDHILEEDLPKKFTYSKIRPWGIEDKWIDYTMKKYIESVKDFDYNEYGKKK